ncbi:MAG: hypothetical protein HDT14_04165 [Oscillibacter sp.]|nr:hypothetical protein [Oscillibacter sp.]
MDDKTKQPLIDKLEKCMLDRIVAAGTKEGGPDLLDAYQLQAFIELQYYLKVEHDFQADEVAALLQFSDPLAVAKECWKERDPKKGFPICALLHRIDAYKRFPLVTPAVCAKENADQLQALKDRIDQNMSDFQAELLGMDKMEIIAKSAKITAMQESHAFMKEDYDFTPVEVSLLLGMENPLKFIADKWPSDLAGFLDMDDQIREALDDAARDAVFHREAEQSAPPEVKAAGQAGKASVRDDLRDKMREAGQRLPSEGKAKGGEVR